MLLSQTLARLVFCLNGMILLPYSFWVFFIERGSFGRGPVVLVVAGLLLLTVLLSQLARPFSLKYKKTLIITTALGLLLFGAGLLVLLASLGLVIIAVYYLPHLLNLKSDQHLGLTAAAVVLCVGVMYPLMSSMYFRGIYDGIKPNYARSNPFYQLNKQFSRGPEVDIANSRERILFLGDSTTFGFPYRAAEAYPALIEQQMPPWVKIINAGLIGHDVAHMNFRWPRLKQFKPTMIFLMPGFHAKKITDHLEDLEGSSPQRTLSSPLFLPPTLLEALYVGLTYQKKLFLQKKQRADLRPFIQELEKLLLKMKEIKTVVCLQYPTFAAPIIQQNIAVICKKHGRTYLNLKKMLGQPLRTANDDRTHPDREGHRRIARILVKFIDEQLNRSF